MKPARIETLAALLLLIVLTALTLSLMVTTGGAYRSLRQNSARLQGTRTGLCFIATRVRESDSGRVTAVTAPWGGSALVIAQASGSAQLEDWIYSTGGSLREVLVPSGTAFQPAAGQLISQSGEFIFRRSGSLLEIRTPGSSRPILRLHLLN